MTSIFKIFDDVSSLEVCVRLLDALNEVLGMQPPIFQNCAQSIATDEVLVAMLDIVQFKMPNIAELVENEHVAPLSYEPLDLAQ